MKLTTVKLAFCVAFAFVLAACGTPGVPLPPSLELAKPVSDLKAVRKGDKVFLTWTAPTQTTDGHNIRHAGETQVCRTIGSPMTECRTAVARLSPEKARTGKSSAPKSVVHFSDDLSAAISTSDGAANATYAIDVFNSYGRSAGLSNKVEVPAAPVLPAPGDFQAQLAGDGVHLSWAVISPPPVSEVRFVCRVYRREQGTSSDVVAGEVPLSADSPASLLDMNFEWEKTYTYRATVVTIAGDRQVEGDDSPVINVVAHDVFPPATPSGVQAAFSGPGQKPFIDIVWRPNTESDLAGYNLYRHETGGPPKQINSEPVKSPAFRDSDVVPGHEYFYSVSAKDVRDNESPRSEEASEKVPER